MKVLLSAYACEPNRGSEPEICWQRALHMKTYADEVWVLTRSNNREAIEADPLGRTAGLHFIYYDLPLWALKLKKHRWLMSIYFALWQWGAGRLAAQHHREKQFDCVYHVTFTGMLAGSFMGRLKIPFIVGPIAGGERAPFRLRRGMLMSGKLKELLRDFGVLLQRYNPLACQAYAAADRIYVATTESLRLIRPKWHKKTFVQLSIATCDYAVRGKERRLPEVPRFVFAGRLLHWKGIHFAIRALAETVKAVPSATLTLVGSGQDEGWLRNLANKLGVKDSVEFAGQISRQQLIDSLHGYSALVFPSLHDSGGSAVLEALQEEVPVICLDLGGPGVMIDASCGIVVSTANADEARTVKGIADAMVALATMPAAEAAQLSRGAIARAKELSWVRLTERIVIFQR